MARNQNEQNLKETLKRYLKQQTSVEENQAIDHWYETLSIVDNQRIPRSQSWFQKNYWYAAAALLVLVTSLLLWSDPWKAQQTSIRLQARTNEIKEVKLADGTKVTLNGGACLTIAPNFGDQTRGVELQGEAFFQVVPDAQRPFQIRTGSLETKVLGTSFNVNANPELGHIKIAVVTGKVKVIRHQAKANVVLAEGLVASQSLSFNNRSHLVEIATENTSLLAGWKERLLYIDNNTISGIAKQLERFYGFKVHNQVPISNNGTFTVAFGHQPLTEVLAVLSELTHTDFKFHNKQIMINPRTM